MNEVHFIVHRSSFRLMTWLYYILTLLVMLVGMFLNIVGLPGIWLMIAAVAIYAWLTGVGQFVGLTSLMVLVGIGLLAELVEFLAGSAGAKKAGGSKRAAIGAIVGGLIGGLFLSVVPIPIISTIIGACLGAFIGAAIVEYMIFKDADRSMRVGLGAMHGRFLGIIGKLIFSIIIFLVAAIVAFPLSGSTTTTTPNTPPATTQSLSHPSP
jgi:uncharacterized protein YqgC (DUF456 family)